MSEQWLPVPGYEDFYSVSDQGRVRSFHAGRGKGKRGGLLQPAPNLSGKLTVVLCRDGTKRTWQVHQLVLLTFAGPPPAGMESLHGPGGPLDNRWPQNLRYGTRGENMADRIRDGTSNRGERSGTAKLTEAIVLECRRRYAASETQTALAAEFGIDISTMSMLIRGLRWAHIPDGLDAIPPPRRAQGEAHGAAKLTDAKVMEIRSRYRAGGISTRALAREYGVSQPVIHKITNHKIWAHLP